MGGLSASRWANAPFTSRSGSSRPGGGVAPSSIFPSSRLDEPLPSHIGGGASSNSGSSPGGGGGSGGGHRSRVPPQQELSRFLKIVSRIRWKLPFLDHGYKLATDRSPSSGRSKQDIEASEIHFKIDFYEFYMHLERAIVHLLGVYGVDVHPSGGLANGVSSSSSTNGNDNNNKVAAAAAAAGGAAAKLGPTRERIGQHQYHVNVLLALDDPANPLHAVLGQGDARRQLWSAKDLRNRWKTADSDESRRYNTVAPLESYNLEEMLLVILAALEEAYNVTLRYVEEMDTMTSDPQIGGGAAARIGGGSSGGTEEQDWGFIADAMDWEAV